MKKTNKKGFTLVELVIVVAVMAVLVAVAIPIISNVKGEAEKSVAATNAQTIESMIKLGEAEGKVSDAATLTTYLNGTAKLGIDKGTFYYNKTTGNVTTTAISGADLGYTITYTAGTAAVE